MAKNFTNILQGYQAFRKKYALGDASIMQHLSRNGQNPKIMVVACCDSRVDPALILQCEPGDLFVVRNVANIIPPFEKDEMHHGTSAALEFGICFLNVSHLIILGHSQCGGIQASMDHHQMPKNDFISNWVSLIDAPAVALDNIDQYAQRALNQSYQNCLTFPWIRQKLTDKDLVIHSWFFDIKTGQIFTYDNEKNSYTVLDA